MLFLSFQRIILGPRGTCFDDPLYRGRIGSARRGGKFDAPKFAFLVCFVFKAYMASWPLSLVFTSPYSSAFLTEKILIRIPQLRNGISLTYLTVRTLSPILDPFSKLLQ